MPADITLAELNKTVATLGTKLNRSPEVKGAQVMVNISDAPNTYFLRRPSGIMALDLDTGGGLPAGGLTYLSGPDGSGKTFLLYKYFAQAQKLYREKTCLALGVSEAAPDHFFMRKCGMQITIPEEMIAQRVDERKIRGWPPFTKEELKDFRAKTLGHVLLLRGANGEELLDGLLECFEKKCFDIIGLDSVSAVLPEADAGKDLDENAKRAAAAGMLTRFFQHYLNGTTGYYGTNPTTVIFTAQVRSNAKKAEAPAHLQKYMPDFAPSGAWAAKHGKLIDILIRSGSKEKESVNVGTSASGEQKTRRTQVGKNVIYEVLKGKAGLHEGIVGEFDFHFPATPAERYNPRIPLTQDQRGIIVAGIQAGVIHEDANGVSVINPFDQTPYNGLANIANTEVLAGMMDLEFELELLVRRSVLSARGIECAYR